jgi:hypothetical protein
VFEAHGVHARLGFCGWFYHGCEYRRRAENSSRDRDALTGCFALFAWLFHALQLEGDAKEFSQDLLILLLVSRPEPLGVGPQPRPRLLDILVDVLGPAPKMLAELSR